MLVLLYGWLILLTHRCFFHKGFSSIAKKNHAQHNTASSPNGQSILSHAILHLAQRNLFAMENTSCQCSFGSGLVKHVYEMLRCLLGSCGFAKENTGC